MDHSHTTHKNILITGALGHIGSKLISSLLYHSVKAVDNLYTYRYSSLFNLKNIISFRECPFESLVADDLKDINIVIHLAAIADASRHNKDTYQINVTETKRFIRLCQSSGVNQFIFPSSTSVYGKADTVVREDDVSTINPQSLYATTKLIIEEELKGSDLPFIILRLGTIFGISPGMRFHTAINKFCWQAATKQPLTVWKENYEQVRAYLGLEDLICLIKKLIDSNIRNEIFNAVSTNASCEQIVSIIQRHRKADLMFIDTPLLNQYSYEVSNQKVCDMLPFEFTNSIEEDGIKPTLNLFENLA